MTLRPPVAEDQARWTALASVGDGVPPAVRRIAFRAGCLALIGGTR